jgi:hypothetical protein
LVLCAGGTDDEGKDPEPAALAVLDSSGVHRVYRFETRFNAMIQSEDGRHVFLFFDESAATEVDNLLFNPNEIGLIDLDQEPAPDVNPRLRTLRSFGGAPRSVAFSPEMMVAGEMRRLAIVLFDSDVAVLDLAHADRSEFTIGLTRPGGAPLGLEQVLFAEQDAKIYLRGAASNDVFVVSLTPSSTATENDFVPSLNQLGAGAGPDDMALFEQEGGTRLLVVSPASSEALVVHADPSQVTSIPLERAASRILLFDAGAPDDPVVERRALLYAEGTNAVTFLDLDGIEEQRGRNAEPVVLSHSYSRVIPLEDKGLVLFIHQDAGLSLLNLNERTVAPINSNQNLTNAVAAEDKLWLAPSGQDRLGYLDLATFHPSEVRLDAPIDKMAAVPSARRPRIAVTHASAVGHVTVVDARAPSNLGRAQSFYGFLLEGVLE